MKAESFILLPAYSAMTLRRRADLERVDGDANGSELS